MNNLSSDVREKLRLRSQLSQPLSLDCGASQGLLNRGLRWRWGHSLELHIGRSASSRREEVKVRFFGEGSRVASGLKPQEKKEGQEFVGGNL